MAVARNRPFNSCKIEDNEGFRPFLRPSVSLVSPPSTLSRSLFTPALFLSHSCLPVEPNPAPRSRVQRRSLHRSVINHRRVGLTRLHAREPARARRELLSSPFFFLFLSLFLSFFFLHFVTRRRKKGADGAKKSDEKLRKAVIVVPKFVHSFPFACFNSERLLFVLFLKAIVYHCYPFVYTHK